MSELQKAIEEITYKSRKFPAKAFQVIRADRERAIPYLRAAIEKAIQENDELGKDYHLYFYALFLLAEFEDREFFCKIMELISLPGEVLESLFGSAVASGLRYVVYQTYNGDLELLKTAIKDKKLNVYARAELLDVIGQLYLDGILEEEAWREFLRQNIYSGEEYSYFYNALEEIICRCHFVDMLPDIRYLYKNNLLDIRYIGEYDACVDYMFEYDDYEKNFCKPKLNADEILKDWAMFEEDMELIDDSRYEEGIKSLLKDMMEWEKFQYVEENELCPCGSGKKYQCCCLKKPKSPLDEIESVWEREKCLKNYPYVGNEKQEDKIYLEDYFDKESIEIDRHLYLGLAHRSRIPWLIDEEREECRCREYLSIAFKMFTEKIKKERISSFEEYDKTFSIHYFCEEWMDELLRLLKKNGNKQFYAEVEEKFLYLTEN